MIAYMTRPRGEAAIWKLHRAMLARKYYLPVAQLGRQSSHRMY